MRIVDDQGMDITWLRSHHPINFHAMKLADPSFEVPIGFRSVVESCEKDGEDVRAFPFELYRDYLVGGDVEDAADEYVAVDIDEIGDEHILVVGDDGQPEENVWCNALFLLFIYFVEFSAFWYILFE